MVDRRQQSWTMFISSEWRWLNLTLLTLGWTPSVSVLPQRFTFGRGCVTEIMHGPDHWTEVMKQLPQGVRRPLDHKVTSWKPTGKSVQKEKKTWFLLLEHLLWRCSLTIKLTPNCSSRAASRPSVHECGNVWMISQWGKEDPAYICNSSCANIYPSI